MRRPARRFVHGAGRGLLSPMDQRRSMIYCPAPLHLRPFVATLSICQAMVEPKRAGPTHGSSQRQGTVTRMHCVWAAQ